MTKKLLLLRKEIYGECHNEPLGHFTSKQNVLHLDGTMLVIRTRKHFRSSLLDNADASQILTHQFSLRSTNKNIHKHLKINITRLRIPTSQKQTIGCFQAWPRSFTRENREKLQPAVMSGSEPGGPTTLLLILTCRGLALSKLV